MYFVTEFMNLHKNGNLKKKKRETSYYLLRNFLELLELFSNKIHPLIYGEKFTYSL